MNTKTSHASIPYGRLVRGNLASMYLYRTKHRILKAIHDETVSKKGQYVIIPNSEMAKRIRIYNAEERIPQALGSLFIQGMINFETGSVNGARIMRLTDKGLLAYATQEYKKL